ncbi:MAG: aminoglycoside phosphotransferase family protein [Microthrixaceae bacterium]
MSDPQRAWLDGLGPTVDALCERWSLEVGSPFQPGGRTAWVAPARRRDGTDAVLKVAWRHDEALHEADGLQAWRGEGAVHLLDRLDVDAQTTALLLERCNPGTPLSQRPAPEQDEVIAGLLPRLWVEPLAGHPFRSLQEMCDRWADGYERKSVDERRSVDRGVAREGIALLRALATSADRYVLLCTDLHAGNVLAADREPWLVIDPKPYVGDPSYDAVQHLLNCPDRLRADPLGLVARVAGLLDLDKERVRLWLFARCVQESPTWPGLAAVAAQVRPA